VEKYGRAKQATDGNIIRRMRFACWGNKPCTHSEYVTRTAFARQKLLPERASILPYTYIASVVFVEIDGIIRFLSLLKNIGCDNFLSLET
jgi:hypothetical protein